MANRELIVGGGCFWCTEAVFELLKGVSDVESGYANGETFEPSYTEICTGETGHAEVIKITYDDAVITTDIGPLAFEVFERYGIKIFQAKGKINDALLQLEEGKLSEVTKYYHKLH